MWLNYILIVQGDRRSFRQPEMTTPKALPPPLIFTIRGSRPPAFQLPAAGIPSSSTQPMFQPAFDTTTEDQLGWD
jgi:hypothetical protein